MRTRSSKNSVTKRLQAAPRESLVERAYREIRRRILDNEYTPLQQVLERELAADLGMSRTPLREALVRLQQERFIQLVPRHGMRVMPLSIQELRDVYEVLTALELTAVERLARASLNNGTIEGLDAALDSMDVALEKDDLDAWVKADEQFHRTLFALCGNERLAAMAEALWDQGHRARATTVRLRASQQMLQVSNREHRALLRAIRDHNWKDARQQHLRHRARATNDIVKLLEQSKLGTL